MRFALFPNLSKHESLKIAIEIRDYLHQKGASVTTEDEKAAALGVPPLSSFNPDQINFLISLGGDGTILRIVHAYPKLHAPIIGINMGSLGFMADVPIEETYAALQAILDGNFSVTERIMIEGTIHKNDSCFAINEIVIHRASNACLIELSVEIENTYLNTFSADGLIISTPNGSTAYSMAAGGPIVAPDLNALVITPICPHTISNRPIVVSYGQEIKVKYQSPYDPAEVGYDGFALQKIHFGEELLIRPSSQKFRLVTFPKTNFFSTLRSKLGWTGKSKSY